MKTLKENETTISGKSKMINRTLGEKIKQNLTKKPEEETEG
nr:hypothetical protein [Mycoplasmopsis bovis]